MKSCLPDFARNIRVGPFSISVETVARDVADLGRFNGGFIAETLRIIIQECFTPQRMREVLLHEIIHAMHDAYGWPAEMTEENLSMTLPAALIQFQQDNPALFGWLFYPGPSGN
jgi:hypothetical protein